MKFSLKLAGKQYTSKKIFDWRLIVVYKIFSNHLQGLLLMRNYPYKLAPDFFDKEAIFFINLWPKVHHDVLSHRDVTNDYG